MGRGIRFQRVNVLIIIINVKLIYSMDIHCCQNLLKLSSFSAIVEGVVKIGYDLTSRP